MIFDNYKKTIIIKLRRFIIAIICMLIIIFSLMTDWFQFYEKSEIHITLIVSALYILFYIYEYLLNHHYLYFNDEGQKIVVKFHTLRFLQRQNKAIEIPKQTFTKYEIAYKFAKKVEVLTLYQKFNSKIFKYPDINLSLLNKEERSKIKKALDKYAKSKPE